MMKRVTKTKHKSRRAFTLVELIVVLVILAVVAAMLVPALTGYIKKAKKERYYEDAHYALVACQSVITEVYSLGLNPKDFETTTDEDNVYWYKDNHNGRTGNDADWGDKVLALMDRQRDENEPYILIFGVGNFKPDAKKYFGINSTDLCTVYYIAYVATEDAPAVFYINGKWQYEYPKLNKSTSMIKEVNKGTRFKNTIVLDKDGNSLPQSEQIPLTFYVVSNRSNIDISNAQFWSENNKKGLKGHSEPFFKG
jgi:prepilin-type N-terminal cleavage/methylation domain-containing protein